jgi:hypothetical protein
MWFSVSHRIALRPITIIRCSVYFFRKIQAVQIPLQLDISKIEYQVPPSQPSTPNFNLIFPKIP